MFSLGYARRLCRPLARYSTQRIAQRRSWNVRLLVGVATGTCMLCWYTKDALAEEPEEGETDWWSKFTTSGVLHSAQNSVLSSLVSSLSSTSYLVRVAALRSLIIVTANPASAQALWELGVMDALYSVTKGKFTKPPFLINTDGSPLVITCLKNMIIHAIVPEGRQVDGSSGYVFCWSGSGGQSHLLTLSGWALWPGAWFFFCQLHEFPLIALQELIMSTFARRIRQVVWILPQSLTWHHTTIILIVRNISHRRSLGRKQPLNKKWRNNSAWFRLRWSDAGCSVIPYIESYNETKLHGPPWSRERQKKNEGSKEERTVRRRASVDNYSSA